MNYETSSNLKEEIAKRYTWRYAFTKLLDRASEALWMLIAFAFIGAFLIYFGGHILVYCLAH